jgi:hypothetical protein
MTPCRFIGSIPCMNLWRNSSNQCHACNADVISVQYSTNTDWIFFWRCQSRKFKSFSISLSPIRSRFIRVYPPHELTNFLSALDHAFRHCLKTFKTFSEYLEWNVLVPQTIKISIHKCTWSQPQQLLTFSPFSNCMHAFTKWTLLSFTQPWVDGEDWLMKHADLYNYCTFLLKSAAALKAAVRSRTIVTIKLIKVWN